ncbi:MAG: hypothetical protein ACFHVJ_03850 [Aestuariibacter sp.]
MLKLGQRGWNNVLIFAMLFMVFLFSTSNKLLQNNSEQPTSMRLFPPYTIVMKIQFADVTLQRIGQDWRIDNTGYEVAPLVVLLHRWEGLEVQPIADPPVGNPYIITLSLAGEEKPRVVSLYEQQELAVISYQGNYFNIDKWGFRELVPRSD